MIWSLKSSSALIFSNISPRTNSMLSLCSPDGQMVYGVILLFEVGSKSSCSQFVLYLFTVSVPIFLLHVETGTMWHRRLDK